MENKNFKVILNNDFVSGLKESDCFDTKNKKSPTYLKLVNEQYKINNDINGITPIKSNETPKTDKEKLNDLEEKIKSLENEKQQLEEAKINMFSNKQISFKERLKGWKHLNEEVKCIDSFINGMKKNFNSCLQWENWEKERQEKNEFIKGLLSTPDNEIEDKNDTFEHLEMVKKMCNEKAMASMRQ